MNPIAVMGGGSLGLLLAGRLGAAGTPVELWTRSEEQAERLRREGVAVLEAEGGAAGAGSGSGDDASDRAGASELAVRAKPTAAAAAPVAAMPFGRGGAPRRATVLLAVKQTALTDELLEALSRILAPGSALVCFCNGVGHVERLAEALPGIGLAAAVTTEGALRTDGRTVVHTGKGVTWLGPAPRFDAIPVRDAAMPSPDAMRDIENRLQQAGFTVSLSNNMAERMLRKLLINAVVNPLTALLRVRNGELAATPERLALMRELHGETADILRRCGLPREEELPDGELWDELLDVCARTAANRSSMLQDAMAGRPNEIDAINGAVVRIAKRLGTPAPWNEKIAALARAISSE
ncbi:2-dehydropantoate 2-reductase [Cohnella xylanilytica]|uniref:2-dehydropantoate 2-reductase n=1 Tax=Cohnella xylanilytica TaxID=557555 RepID=A0A841U4A3_9BACL|nr:2-dehydropantoate 2-reductase [Cohnella xylanilytica]MBB6695426.1 2-dehydropantoate 2-reductase [Cohnella xylanilytica]